MQETEKREALRDDYITMAGFDIISSDGGGRGIEERGIDPKGKSSACLQICPNHRWKPLPSLWPWMGGKDVTLVGGTQGREKRMP